jgi:hypothetical protein
LKAFGTQASLFTATSIVRSILVHYRSGWFARDEFGLSLSSPHQQITAAAFNTASQASQRQAFLFASSSMNAFLRLLPLSDPFPVVCSLLFVFSMGETTVSQDVFHEFLQSISSRFTPQTYSLLKHNCNNFTNECALFLLKKEIPSCLHFFLNFSLSRSLSLSLLCSALL